MGCSRSCIITTFIKKYIFLFVRCFISTAHNVPRYTDGLTPTGRKIDPLEVQALRDKASNKQKYVFFDKSGDNTTPTTTSVSTPIATTANDNNNAESNTNISSTSISEGIELVDGETI